MASFNNQKIPAWIADVKEDTTKTTEWNELTRHIYDAVDQLLSQSHVPYFTDLTEAEKNVLLERAARSLASSDTGKVYENLQSKLSYFLDQSVNNQVAKKMLEDNFFETKTELVLDTTTEGIISLLRKNPEQKYKLRVFLNQQMPAPLRFFAMQIYFANQNHRKTFVNKLTTNPKLCLSPIDVEIQKRCESMLNTAVTFKELRNSKGNLNSIKGVLSYYHSTIAGERNLNESEYLYSVPIVYAHHPPLPANESPTERTMAILIEIYMQFVQTLPVAIIHALNGVNDNPQMDAMISAIIGLLQEYDESFLNFFRELTSQSSVPGMEEITFQTAFKSICAPMLKNLFTNYLSLNTLMFVWDQYIISSDVTGYHEELLPVIAACVLMIIRDQLMSTKSIGEFDDCLKNQANFIQTRQMQSLVNIYFFRTLQAKLNSSTPHGPVIDPTVGRLQPWEHWHQDIVPKRIQRSKDTYNSDERLQAEISKRIAAERAAQAEIERLRKELERLRNQPKTTVIHKPEQQQTVQPQASTLPPPRDTTPDQIREPALDITKRLKFSVNKILNGDGNKRKELDAMTLEDLRLHKLDLKMAEKQIFGRQLKTGEWDALSEVEKQIKSERMLEIVKQRLQKRFNETGRF